MAKRTLQRAALALLVVALGTASACSSSDDDAPPKPTGPAPGASLKGPCGSNDDVKGVVRSFCDGPGSITFVIGEVKGTIDGGTCSTEGDRLTFNAGTVVDDRYTGRRPSYAGALLPAEPGEFGPGDASMQLVYKGQATAVLDLQGSHDGEEGLFSGRSAADGTKVTGSFTC